jgi:hypothetical protein
VKCSQPGSAYGFPPSRSSTPAPPPHGRRLCMCTHAQRALSATRAARILAEAEIVHGRPSASGTAVRGRSRSGRPSDGRGARRRRRCRRRGRASAVRSPRRVACLPHPDRRPAAGCRGGTRRPAAPRGPVSTSSRRGGRPARTGTCSTVPSAVGEEHGVGTGSVATIGEGHAGLFQTLIDSTRPSSRVSGGGAELDEEPPSARRPRGEVAEVTARPRKPRSRTRSGRA